MSGLHKNKLSNQNLRALLERINEKPSRLGRDFHIDRTVIYYYRRKLMLAEGRIDLLIENRQQEWRPRHTDAVPTLTLRKLKSMTDQICRPEKCYADYLKDEENKLKRKEERLFKKHY